MSLGVYSFRLSVTTKSRRKFLAPQLDQIALDLLITQSGENIYTQDSRAIALNQRIARLLLTEDINTIITQSGDFINTNE